MQTPLEEDKEGLGIEGQEKDKIGGEGQEKEAKCFSWEVRGMELELW